MIVVEFVVFVVSSGVFYSERFRRNVYAVVAAGVLAAASSLLFFWHLAERWTGKPETSPVQIVRQIVEKPVVPADSDPAIVGTPRDCKQHYPFWSSLWGDKGTTRLAFTVMSDGTVKDLKVAQSSGSERLDEAAIDCVKRWHYKPALRKGKIADAPWTAQVVWGEDEAKPAAAPDAGKTEE